MMLNASADENSTSTSQTPEQKAASQSTSASTSQSASTSASEATSTAAASTSASQAGSTSASVVASTSASQSTVDSKSASKTTTQTESSKNSATDSQSNTTNSTSGSQADSGSAESQDSDDVYPDADKNNAEYESYSLDNASSANLGSLLDSKIGNDAGSAAAAVNGASASAAFDTSKYLPADDPAQMGSVVKFNTFSDAVTGALFDLPMQTKIGYDHGQYMNFQVKQVYVYLDPQTDASGVNHPVLKMVYIPGTTTFQIQSQGADNNANVYVGNSNGAPATKAGSPVASTTTDSSGNKVTVAADPDYYTANTGTLAYNEKILDASTRHSTTYTWSQIGGGSPRNQEMNTLAMPSMSDADAAKVTNLNISYVSDSGKSVDNTGNASGLNDGVAYSNVKVQNLASLQAQTKKTAADLATMSQNVSDAVSKIDGQAQDTINKIQNDKTLTSDQKQNAENQIKDNVTSAKNTLNSTIFPSDFAKNNTNATNSVTTYQTQPSVATQVANAESLLDSELSTVLGNIKADTGLTQSEKDKQSAKAQSDHDTPYNALKALNTNASDPNSNDADDITKIMASQQATDLPNDYTKSTSSAKEQQQAAATQGATDAATASSAIDGNQNLSDTDKTNLKNAISSALKDLQNDPGTDAETVAQHKLALEKAMNKAYVAAAAADAKAAAAQDPNLQKNTTALSAQQAQIQKQADTATAQLDSAKETDDLTAMKNTAVDNMKKLQAAQQAANKAVADALTTAKNKVETDPSFNNMDPTAAATAKKAQEAALQQQADATMAEINKATNADQAKAAGNDAGKTTDLQKDQAAANKQIADALTKAQQNVDADPSLANNPDAKTAQKNALAAQAAAAQKAVGASTDPSEVANAGTAGSSAVSGLQAAQESANKAVADSLTKAQAAVDADPSLANNPAGKAAQKKALADQAAAAQKNDIANATTPDQATQAGNSAADGVKNTQDGQQAANKTVADALTDAQKAVDADPSLKNNPEAVAAQKKTLQDQANAAQTNDITNAASPAAADAAAQKAASSVTDLQAAQQASNAALAKAASDAENGINNNAAFSKSEKAKRLADLQAAQKTAQDAINNATTPTDAAAASGSNSPFANAAKTAGDASNLPSIDDQKKTATEAIDGALKNAEAAVDADPNASAADKAAQKKTLETQADKDKQAVTDAKTADDIQDASDKGTKDISGLQAAQQAADADLAKKAKDAEDAINGNPNLSKDEKAKRVAAIEAAKKTAQDTINNATTPADATAATGSDSAFAKAAATAGDTTGLPTVADQQKTAKNAIADALKSAEAAVDTDPNASDADKAAQKKTLEAQADAANKAIDGAESADDVTAASDKGAKDISDLQAAEQAADADLAKKAKDAEDAINANPVLSKEEKAKRVADVEAAKKAAQDIINNATTPDEANAATAKGSVFDQASATAGDTSKLPTVAQQKQSALSDLQDAADKAKAAIDADKTLSANEKATQKAAIDADKTLSANEKATQKAAIDAALKAAQADVNSSNGAQDILDAQAKAAKAMADAHQPGQDLAAQKAAALAKIDEKAAEIRARIMNDPKLTQEQKNKDLAMLDDAVAKAKAAVNNAQDADSILDGIKIGTVDAEAAYETTVQEQYAEPKPQPALPDTSSPVLPETSRVARHGNDSIFAAEMLAAVSAFFFAGISRRKKNDK
ncbi:DUF1542 domain-containing protein [Fructobacillus ficulneus]|uniref:DUF1542 domain-containing protein n=1 Tax=Fructobacillus ficulneus TaxID=157463 RepID=A0A0K8MIA7_9LACO|nr:DUF1542 domain-containing protein [Fructobacillus ficulneus]GAP00302.1 hypothetical protein FFIC_283160 [Fructobacillus ficulneus]